MLSEMISFLIQLVFWAIIVEEIVEGLKRMISEMGEKYLQERDVQFPSMLVSWILSITIAFAIQADIIEQLGYVSVINNLGIILSGAIIGLGSNGIYSVIQRYEDMKHQLEDRSIVEVDNRFQKKGED